MKQLAQGPAACVSGSLKPGLLLPNAIFSFPQEKNRDKPQIGTQVGPHHHFQTSRGQIYTIIRSGARIPIGRAEWWGHRLWQRAADLVLNSPSQVFLASLSSYLFCTKVFLISPPQLPIPTPPFLPRPSDSLFIKEMKSICIIHFFCELFPLQGACSLCLGSKAIDRRPKSKGREIPSPLGQDRAGTKVRAGPLLTDTSGSIIPSH